MRIILSNISPVNWTHFIVWFTLMIGCVIGKGQQFNQKQYLTEGGLSSNIVYHVFQDQDKFIWASTEIGICRFDGQNFKKYGRKDGLTDHAVFEMKEGPAGKKWILTGNGKLCHIELNGDITVDSSLFMDKALSEILFLKDGTIVLSSFGGGIRMRKANGEIKSVISSNADVSENYASYLWQPEHSNAVFAISSSFINEIDIAGNASRKVAFKEPIHFSRACKVDNDWILCSVKKKLVLTDGDSVKVVKGGENLTSHTLNQLCTMSRGQFAACTNQGVYFFEIENGELQITGEALTNYKTTNIIQDHEGNYWVSTLGSGLFRLQKTSVKVIGEPLGAYSFYEDSSASIYIGYGNYRFGQLKHGSIRYSKIKRKNDYTSQKINEITKRGDALWFMLDGGSARYINGQTEFFRTGNGTLLFDRGRVLLGNQVGYWEVDYDYLMDSLISSSSFQDNLSVQKRKFSYKTTAIEKCEDRFLIGTNEGLFLQDQDKVTRSRHALLSRAKITDIFVKDAACVISTYGDGVFYILENDTIQITEKEGVLSNYCQSVFIHEKAVFVGSNKGLNVIHHILQKEEWEIIAVTNQNGLTDSDIQDIVVSERYVLLATLKGVHQIPLNSLSSEVSHEVPFYLEGMGVNGLNVDAVQTHEFSYMQNQFSFRFIPVVFGDRDRVKLFYTLDAEENNSWQEFNGKYLEFKSLVPGSYSLNVKAVLDKKESNVFKYEFEILPPFWKTWWFLMALVLLIAAIIYWFFKVRVLTYNKDVVRELIQIILNKLKKEAFVMVKNVADGSQTKINLNQLNFIKGANNYVELNSSQYPRNVLVRMTLKEVLELVASDSSKQVFVRCHKSYIVNARKVTAIHSGFIKLGEERIPTGNLDLEEIHKILRIPKK